MITAKKVGRGGRRNFSTDFHNSFESHPSRKPFPWANLTPTVSNSDVHSNNNIVILDLQCCLCYSGCSLHRGGERSASLCPLPLYLRSPPLIHRSLSPAFDVQMRSLHPEWGCGTFRCGFCIPDGVAGPSARSYIAAVERRSRPSRDVQIEDPDSVGTILDSLRFSLSRLGPTLTKHVL
jgi:hypothetical protein